MERSIVAMGQINLRNLFFRNTWKGALKLIFVATADTHVHFYCYKHGYGTLSDHPVLLWQGQNGKLH